MRGRVWSIGMFLAVLLGGAGAKLCPAADARAVEARGEAAIVVDPVSARDRALIDAKVKAVEQISGTQVESRALYSMGLSQDDYVRIRAFGFVERHEILREHEQSDRYTVEIRAWIASGEQATREKANQLLSQRGFLVLGDGDGARHVVERLKSALVQQRLQVYDEQFLGERLPAGAGQRELLAAAERVLADYVVRVTTHLTPLGEMYGIQSYQGDAQLELTEISTGLLKGTARAGARVFGLSREQARDGARGDQFPQAVAAPAIQNFLAELARLEVGVGRSVRLVLEAPSSPYVLDRLVRGVGELRWVQNPRDAVFAPDRATLQVEYPETILYLAADLDYLPGFAVVSYGPGRIVVREEPP